MDEMRFEAEIIRDDRIPADVVRERVYGNVRVRAEWPEDRGTPETRVAVSVVGHFDRRDAPAYVDLFFHDVFLLLNLASPGSFGGTVSIGVREFSLSPRVFASAPRLQTLPLEKVVTWYDGLAIGTQQVATSDVTTALFQLLKLARSEEDDELSVLLIASAAEALLGERDSLRRLFELRDELALGRTQVFHPMHDDALDARVEDATREWIELADEAAGMVIRELQRRIRNA